MDGREQVVTHARLIRKVWGSKRDLENAAILWQSIDRLRKKLSKISPTNEYIEIERGVGYRFSA
jgi:DNA-binding response OmpR family regulator